MHWNKFLMTAWLCGTLFSAFGQQGLSPKPSEYLSEVLNIIQRNALHRDSVDWPRVKKQAKRMATKAKNYGDCHSAIRFALDQLGDKHSLLVPASIAKVWSQGSLGGAKNFPITSGEMLEGKYAYLTMPYFSSGNKENMVHFADQLHNLLERLDQANPQGWILDLRGNQGGNCWPMLAGIGPLLGQGVSGYFVYPQQERTPSAWFYEGGRAGEGNKALTEVSRIPYQLRQTLPPVAVLTGPSTASSGEVITVAFCKRPNTRSFGEPTAGLSTGNETYPLADGAMLVLTTSIYADREKVPYGKKIMPDELIEGATEENDVVLEAAKRWLDNFNKTAVKK